MEPLEYLKSVVDPKCCYVARDRYESSAISKTVYLNRSSSDAQETTDRYQKLCLSDVRRLLLYVNEDRCVVTFPVLMCASINREADKG